MSNNLSIMTGQTFYSPILKKLGRLTIIKENEDSFSCHCDCGKELEVSKKTIKTGKIKSCGCIRIEKLKENNKKRILDLTGKRFGRLVVLKRIMENNDLKCLCKCDCGTEKNIGLESLKKGHVKSCGCYHKEVWQNLIRNPNLTEAERELNKNRRGSEKTREWRKKVYERDNYICQICGDSNGGNLIAHHISSWDTFKSERYSIDNGVTICEKCHKNFHHVYGLGNNDQSQWNSFKSDFQKEIPLTRKIRKFHIDLTNQKFGRLTVIEKDMEKETPSWKCLCDCGVLKTISSYSLKKGRVKSCGCLQKEIVKKIGESNAKIYTGQEFGNLIVLEKREKGNFLCVCKCGNKRIVNYKLLMDKSAHDCQSNKNGNKCKLRGSYGK